MATTLTLGAANLAENHPLSDAQLDGLLTGNTMYIGLPPGGPGGPNGGEAAFHYGADGRAVARLPTGTGMVGEWRLGGEKYCVSWENGPQNSCTRIFKVNGAIELRDAATGEARGKIARFAPGNPENL